MSIFSRQTDRSQSHESASNRPMSVRTDESDIERGSSLDCRLRKRLQAEAELRSIASSVQAEMPLSAEQAFDLRGSSNMIIDLLELSFGHTL